MKKKFYFTFFCSFTFTLLFGQSKDISLEYYNLANKAIAEKQYHSADSLYTLSIQLMPHPDTYYNRAVVRKHLKNIKGYCDDIGSAANMGDTIANKEFWKFCGKTDTTFYDDNNMISNSSNYSSFEILSKCLYSPNSRFKKYNKEKKLLVYYEVIDNDTIFGPCSELKKPVFKGGESEMFKFIQSNLIYPSQEKEWNISGTVYLTFIVNENGEVKNVTIIRGIKGGKNLNNQALRVVQAMPNWTPGYYNGKPIKTRLNLPVKYTLR